MVKTPQQVGLTAGGGSDLPSCIRRLRIPSTGGMRVSTTSGVEAGLTGLGQGGEVKGRRLNPGPSRISRGRALTSIELHNCCIALSIPECEIIARKALGSEDCRFCSISSEEVPNRSRVV